jgi:ABC-type multidrug transport system fused ATPase/permease subunit
VAANQSVRSLVEWALSRISAHKRAILLLLAVAAGEIFLRVTSPWALKAAVDYVFTPGPAPPWLLTLSDPATQWLGVDARIGLLVTVVAIGMAGHVAHQLTLLMHTRRHAELGIRITRDLRNHLFGHLQCLALGHHARMPAGDAAYRLSNDAVCLEQLVLRVALPTLTSTVTLVTMFLVLLSINPLLSLVSLAVVPGLWLSLRVHTRRVNGEASRVKALESRVIARAQESLATIRLVKTFARESFERKRFNSAVRHATTARAELTHREAGFSFIVGLLTATGTSLVLVVGGMLVVNGTITAGTLLLVLAYLAFINGPLTAISNATAVARDALASAHRIRAMLDVAAEPLEDADVPALPRIKGTVRFEHVSFGYEAERPVLQDVSFSVTAGELIAIVGPSGGGKTTLASLLTRLYEPTEGRILVDDLDIGRCSLRSIREQVAVVSQDALLLSGTVRDNLRYGRLDASDVEVERAARDAYAHEFIKCLPHGYDTDLGQSAGGLSGGQRQRLSIARAFLKDAPILVLDEPTSALDALSETRFVEALNRLRRGRTTFVIAHRLSTVRDANRIFVLDDGCLVAAGTHEQLLRSSSLYAALAGNFTDAGAHSSAASRIA